MIRPRARRGTAGLACAAALGAAAVGGGGVAWAASSAARVPHPPSARGGPAADSLVGRWLVDRAASGDVRRAIDTATGRMNFIIRPIARSRLRGANPVHNRLTIAISATEISTQVDSAPAIVSPADGTPVRWVRDNGDVFELHTTLDGARLVQTFVGKDASRRENVFTPAADGRTLNIAVTVTHPRLPRPVAYRLVYRRE